MSSVHGHRGLTATPSVGTFERIEVLRLTRYVLPPMPNRSHREGRLVPIRNARWSASDSSAVFRRPLALLASLPGHVAVHRTAQACVRSGGEEAWMRVKEGWEGIVVGLVMLAVAMVLIVGAKLLLR